MAPSPAPDSPEAEDVLDREEPFERLCRLLPAQETPYGIRGLGALTEPVLDAIRFERDSGRLPARVVVTHDFDVGAVARLFLVHHHDAIGRLLPFPYTAQTDPQQARFLLKYPLSIADSPLSEKRTSPSDLCVLCVSVVSLFFNSVGGA